MSIIGTNSLIAQVMENEYELSSARLASTSFDPIRNRLLQRLERVCLNLRNLRDWSFGYVDDTVTVLADTTSIALPALWSNEGREGGVWLRDGGAGNSKRLAWKRHGELRKLIEEHSGSGDPGWYSVAGNRNLVVWPPRSSDMVCAVYFRSSGPALELDDPGGLEFFPSQWWHLIYEMVKLEDMAHIGDLAARQVQQGVVEALTFSMCTEERQGKPESDFLPRYAGSLDNDPYE